MLHVNAMEGLAITFGGVRGRWGRGREGEGGQALEGVG